MSFSKTWTDWHLTPRGWESGSEMTDSRGLHEKDPPSDRVLTVRSLEQQFSPGSKMYSDSDEKWKSDDAKLISRLLKKYGEAPAHP